MTLQQLILFAVLGGALFLFAAGRWRYDIVALLALLVVTVTGIVPADRAFAGFGHPAVVTVAAVLVVSRALINSGMVDLISRRIARLGQNAYVQVGALTGLVTLFSSFMNNVGALALLMPVAIRMARRSPHPVSILLMPLAFGSLLGGMTTLIGTPPNIIIATFRAQNGSPPFGMFDFTPVGLGAAAAGVLFIALIGWRLIPQRKGPASPEDIFQIEDYITEVRVPAGSRLVGKSLRTINAAETDVTVVAIVRDRVRRPAPPSWELLLAEDILIVEANSDALKAIVDALGLELVANKRLGRDDLKSEEITLMEAVITPGSRMENRTVRSLDLRARHGVNLLAVARQGESLTERLGEIPFRAGDVLLLQGHAQAVQEAITVLGCLPLAERGLRIGQSQRVLSALGLFGAALALTALNLVPVQVAFVACALAMVLAGFVTLREAYNSVEWPVIVLLGAMIPVGEALESTGGAQLVASGLMRVAGGFSPVITLALLMIITMLLSNVINNAAAALLMAPIALNLAQGLGVAADPLLMGVAVGASAAFMTPIGHQSNTLVLGPGGYRFGDYWRLGLPLTVVTLLAALPLILRTWPF